MMTKMPLVSIVIPVYKGLNFLGEAIDCALSQTYSNIEVVVVDDGSPDNGATEFVARSYGSCISYYRKTNGGTATALNYAITHMKGELFSWLSHDDLYTPDKIEKEVYAYLQAKDPDTIIYCAYKTIDEEGRELQEYHIPCEVSNNPKCLLSLDITYTMNGCALLVPKHLFNRVGDFDPKMKYTQD